MAAVPEAAGHPDAALLAELSGRLDETLRAVIPAGAPVALLDVPDHTNVGDHAITVGELAALRRGGHRLAHVSAIATGDLDRAASRVNGGTVLLHGGGNLGDFWPTHQEYREHVLDRFKGHKVVQLPQSLWFERDDTLLRAQRAFDEHPDFALLVRDEPGLEFARRHFTCRVELCPDSAFAIGPLERRSRPTDDVLCLAREDHERVDGAAAVEAVDWPRPFERSELRLRHLAARLARWNADGLLRRAYERLAWGRVERGLSLLSQGRVVVSDRLHAHILALLLGIPHVVADTRAGKVHGYIDTWTARSSLVHRASTLDEAVRLAGDLR